MSTRIYLVSETDGDERLVRASNQSQAVKHAVGSRFSAKVASQDDLARMLPEGAAIENSGETEETTSSKKGE